MGDRNLTDRELLEQIAASLAAIEASLRKIARGGGGKVEVVYRDPVGEVQAMELSRLHVERRERERERERKRKTLTMGCR